ncbi:MAG: hypothetical protein LR015_09620, partial [Verrucomicrobia bacterium]|nr:hypothetical protein [Verrucomicrobiota bacterium]
RSFEFARLSARPTADEPSNGLGLNISRQLVHLMQGNIGCDSTHGAGAVFWVEFNILPDQMPE